jgi:sulfite reductase alpha subunit-like flavoprotein
MSTIEAASILVLYASETGNAQVCGRLPELLLGVLVRSPGIRWSGLVLNCAHSLALSLARSFSQDCAELLGRQARARGFSTVRVLPADSYMSTIDQLPNENVVVCIASTTGQGEFPHNSRAFWKFLRRKSLPDTLLQTVRYAVFGLGDSGYPKYNFCAKLLNKRFETLGGRAVVPLGLGDDQHPHGYDASLDLWMPKLWESLGAAEVIDGRVLQLEPKFDLEMVSAVGGENPEEVVDGVNTVGHRARQLEAPHDKTLFETTLVPAEVLANIRATPTDWFQDTRVLTLSLPSSSGPLNPGDAVAIWPKQDPEAVREVLEMCKIRYDDLIRVRSRMHREDSMTCRAGHLLEGLVDVHGAPPRRTFIQLMAQLCPDEFHLYKERLVHLSSSKGRDDFYEYIVQEGRNLAEVLADFPCVPMTLDWILSFAPRLQCRYYSAASVATEATVEHESGGLPPKTVDLLAAMVQWRTPGRRLRKGLCSRTIASASIGDSLSVHVATGDLKAPPLDVPLILVGPGTGIAPLRSFLQQRRRAASKGLFIAPAVLFYGCRDRSKDFYFEGELRAMVAEGVLREVVLATSREQTPKQYVQDALKQRQDLVLELLGQGAHVYVCGRADSMPTEVERVLGDLVGDQKQLLSKRLHVECWS